MRGKIVTEAELRWIIDNDLPAVPGITIANDYTVARRLFIVRKWKQVLAVSSLLRIPTRKLTGQFLVTLASEGIHVSVSTLFNWRRQLDRRGIAGLIDKRRGRTLTT